MAKTHVLTGWTEPDVNVGIACGLYVFHAELLMDIKSSCNRACFVFQFSKQTV